MNIEIERKFLPKSKYALNELRVLESLGAFGIVQAYLVVENAAHTRLRCSINKGVSKNIICTKVDIDEKTKAEYETEITDEEASILLKSCKRVLRKNRYSYIDNGHHIDVDYYEDGLIVIEVEYPTRDTSFVPSYCGVEVTGDYEYSNIYLASKKA